MKLLIPPTEVRKYRRKKGLSIEELAEEIGWTPGYIESLESGEVNPPYSRVKKITNVLVGDFTEREWKFDENMERENKIFYIWRCPKCGTRIEGESQEKTKDQAKNHVLLKHGVL
ncbi:MAG: helix-turn-helix domain-containing protein [Candidatus Hadarchaeia archaeon]